MLSQTRRGRFVCDSVLATSISKIELLGVSIDIVTIRNVLNQIGPIIVQEIGIIYKCLVLMGPG